MADFIADTSSFGFKLGRAVGWTSAQAVQRSKQLTEATGDFGKNVAAGASTQYSDTTKSIAAARAAHYAKLAGVDIVPKAEAPKAPAKAKASTAKA